MTTTRPSRYLLALLGAAVFLLGVAGPSRCQRPQRLEYVDLDVIDPDKRGWEVVGAKDKEFLLQRPYDPRDSHYLKNFRPAGGDGMRVSGMYMAYDLEGKTKDVLAEDRYGENARWVKKRGEEQLSARLQVRNGKLKGWWVGVKVIKEKAEPSKPALARLVLVEDEKEAAIFRWDDPNDVSP
jgi:hypothetical protein